MFAPNTKFLVVDDFSTMRKIIKKVLNEIGYTNIVEAVDGRNALETLNDCKKNNEPIDFVISDWNMPNMLGIELLKHCKNDESFKNIPFILVTAESEQSNIVEAIKAGVSEYIVKPFNVNTIKAKIEKVYLKGSAEKKAA